MEVFKTIFIIVILGLFTQQAAAQEGISENNNGSIYSLFGVGQPYDNSTAREMGLGILGVSLDNMQSNTLQNPAMWGKNLYSTASSGFKLSQFTAEDQSTENVNALLETGYLQFTFPLYNQKLGISAALYPVTKSNFRLFSSTTVYPSDEDTVNYISDVNGSGGVNKFEVGLGWNINKNIAVGYAPSLAFITHNNTETTFFEQSGYSTNNLDRKITGFTFAQRFGTLLNFRSLLNNDDRLSIGAAVSLPIEFEAKREVSVIKEVNNQEQEVQISDPVEGNIKLPVELNAGLTYYPSNFVNVSFEGQLQQWSNFESDLTPLDANVKMSDRHRFGLGIEYHPYRLNSDKFLSRFRYSGGVSYDSGHLTIENHDVDTYWMSAGLGILSRSPSSIDLSFQYGLRGASSNILVREKIWALSLSVNLTERMFVRPKFD
ncbi:MAG: hypothetical protein WD059_03805 [Balneolaceae bacterium]